MNNSPMEKPGFQEYRDNLARDIRKEPDHERRHKILEWAKDRGDYNHAENQREVHNIYEKNKEAFEKEYEISPDYIEIIKELKSDPKKYTNGQHFISNNFDVLSANEKFKAKLFFFGNNTDDKISFEKQMEANGFHGAKLHEMLAFLKENPEFGKFPVVASGSSDNFDVETYSPILKTDEKGQEYIVFKCLQKCCEKDAKHEIFFLGVK